MRINFFNIPEGTLAYVAISNSDKENATYIRTWRDAMSDENTETELDKQRRILDPKFIELFGKKMYNQLPK